MNNFKAKDGTTIDKLAIKRNFESKCEILRTNFPLSAGHSQSTHQQAGKNFNLLLFETGRVSSNITARKWVGYDFRYPTYKREDTPLAAPHHLSLIQ